MIRTTIASFAVLAVLATDARAQLRGLPAGFMGAYRPPVQTAPPAYASPQWTPAVAPATVDVSGLHLPVPVSGMRPIAIAAIQIPSSSGTENLFSGSIQLWPSDRAAIASSSRLGRTEWKLSAAASFVIDGLTVRAAPLVRQAAGELAAEPDSRAMISPLMTLVTLQLSVPDGGPLQEASDRLLRLTREHLPPNSEISVVVQTLLAARDSHAGSLGDALRHVDEAIRRIGDQTRSKNDSLMFRAWRVTILKNLGAAEEALDCARLNRQESENSSGKFSGQSAMYTMAESDVVLRFEGPVKAAAMLDEYAEARAESTRADIVTIALEIYRVRHELQTGKADRAVRRLQNAVELAEALLPHRIPHLRLCRAYIADFRGDGVAARTAYDDAMSLTVRMLGQESDTVKALRRHEEHFPTKIAEAKQPYYDAAELDRFLQEFAHLIQMDDMVGIDVSMTPVKLESDAFFHSAGWMAARRIDGIRRRLGVEFEAIDPTLVPSYCGALRVKSVRLGTPAANQGIRQGDLLVAIDDRATVGVTQLWRIVEYWKYPPPYKLSLLRGPDMLDVYVAAAKPD